MLPVPVSSSIHHKRYQSSTKPDVSPPAQFVVDTFTSERDVKRPRVNDPDVNLNETRVLSKGALWMIDMLERMIGQYQVSSCSLFIVTVSTVSIDILTGSSH